jgi:hypothetical protein
MVGRRAATASRITGIRPANAPKIGVSTSVNNSNSRMTARAFGEYGRRQGGTVDRLVKIGLGLFVVVAAVTGGEWFMSLVVIAVASASLIDICMQVASVSVAYRRR